MRMFSLDSNVHTGAVAKPDGICRDVPQMSPEIVALSSRLNNSEIRPNLALRGQP